MPKKAKKTGKERLDKYYHLAKQQGYRARSAFKLIQLNKKYNFLQNSRCLVDLCAAPGGWLQVASQYMPVSSLIIGVDLCPIKPIPKVITHVEDITTDKCLTTLKKDLKDWKADVVLHDGAPNVGTAWTQDAFTQSQLTLSALQLACKLLQKGGWFITKVFRSQDYNHLMWVFGQLFQKVSATKPPSSRNVSAEIFVICQGYKAPDRLDPKFLDPKFVFSEVSNAENLESSKKNALRKLLFPEKKTRHREGYGDNERILFHRQHILEFLLSSETEAICNLSQMNEFSWTEWAKDKDQFEQYDLQQLQKQVRNHPETTDEILECFKDLKVLNRKDYKMILKWRKMIRKDLNLETEKKKTETEIEPIDEFEVAEEEKQEDSELGSEEELDKELNELEKSAALELKRKKKQEKRKREKQRKEQRKKILHMQTPTDIALDPLQQAQDLSVLPQQVEDEVYFSHSSDSELTFVSDNDDFEDEEDDERFQQMEENYQEYLEQKKDLKTKVKKQKYGDFFGFSDQEEEDDDEEMKEDEKEESDNESISSSDMSESEAEPVEEMDIKKQKSLDWLLKQSVFEDVELDTVTQKSKKKQRKEVEAEDTEHYEDMEVDEEEPETNEDFEEEDEPKMSKEQQDKLKELKHLFSQPENIEMALQMVQSNKENKRELLDDVGYNRHTFPDAQLLQLPKWYLDDEHKFNQPPKKLSAEAIRLANERQKQLDARPIKKVMEAKMRKKQKSLKRLEKMRKKMNDLLDDENPGEQDPEFKTKMSQVQQMMKKSVSKMHRDKKQKTQVVVARGANKGRKGRPAGVKGRYKIVDARMKKEVRAQKRMEKKMKKRK